MQFFISLTHFSVLELEKMKECVNSKAKDIEMVSVQPAKRKRTEPKGNRASANNNDGDDDDDDDDDDIGDIDEYLDWRSKKAYK